MKQSIVHVALVVRDYDEAIEFYTRKLHFTLVEDTYQPEQDKRQQQQPVSATDALTGEGRAGRTQVVKPRQQALSRIRREIRGRKSGQEPAVALVESSLGANLIGDDGQSYGAFQMTVETAHEVLLAHPHRSASWSTTKPTACCYIACSGSAKSSTC